MKTLRWLSPAARALVRAGGSVIGGLLDLVYPPLCLLCKGDTEETDRCGLCSPCRRDLPFFHVMPCPGCGGTPVPSPTVFCERCQGGYRRDGLAAALQYTGAARRLIHSFKYGRDLASGGLLAHLLSEAPALAALPRPAAVIPVPLHRSRLAGRGFNQAALLGKHLALVLKTGFLPTGLRRLRDTAPLSGLAPASRLRETGGGFAVRSVDDVRGRSILLVDDVVTTGATVEECCLVLKAAGARNVYVAVAARRLRQRALY